MKLEEIKKLAKPGDKFIRESNSHGCVDVWFTYNEEGVRMVHSWETRAGYDNPGMYIHSRPAVSGPYLPADDWMFYPPRAKGDSKC